MWMRSGRVVRAPDSVNAKVVTSVAEPDPGSGAFLTSGSGIGFFRIPDPKLIFLRAY